MIIIAAGGTGGHVFPAICVAKQITEKNVIFATDERGIEYLGNYKKSAIVQKIKTNNGRFSLYMSLLKNTVKAVLYLARNRPECIIGFGGYPSVPFILAGQFLAIRTIIHEQNAIVGKANKFLSVMAKKILLSFDIANYPVCYRHKTVVTGNPTRFDYMYTKYNYSPSSKSFKILVLGGSQGSKIITEKIIECIPYFPNDVFIYHQVRSGENFDFLSKIYEKYGIQNKIQGFFDEIADIYQNVNLVISRSGASTVFELIGFKVPSILVPYAMSINGDQKANAKILVEAGGAIICNENEIIMYEKIMDLYNNREKLTTMSKSLQKLYKNTNPSKIIKSFINELKTP
jgi:UDP-N-acetylglucosamine--N-acetylmuramyl-(pentapeptide) pyrophosphoryl-undecaprenol N-acetylglucosamine transferase